MIEQHTRYPLPHSVSPHFGEILDVDGHENVPVNLWVEEFGSISKELAAAASLGTTEIAERREVDDVEISVDTVFKQKFTKAPGFYDLKRRLEVLDFVGTKRQFLYPGGLGLFAAVLYSHPDNLAKFSSITGDRRTYGKRCIEAYNDWCVRTGRLDGRLRPVAILIGDSVDELVTEARRLIDAGIRGFWLPSSTPIAGLSPANTALDPLWSLLESAGVPLLTHIGSDEGFLRTDVWRDAQAFEGWKAGGEFQLDPWTLGTIHLATENFLACMILGGVFERFPKLAFGAAEVTAQWIGPLGQTMDLWHKHARKFRQAGGESPLSMKPSDYIRRNVRVSPFDVEDVAAYIDQFALEDVYCYSADFPHAEGGKQPIEDFTANLERHGPDVLRKFFVDNGKILLPD